MLKAFGFVRRNHKLTHDEYRAAHVGYHNSFGRRLNNIRGYLLNVTANRPIDATLGAELCQRLTRGEPDDFDDLWDAWGQLLFDSLDDYLAARSPALDKPGPDGLEYDDTVAKVGGDFDYLYAGSPFQFHVDEHVALPVVRPERKLFKLAQFVKRPPQMPVELFRAMWTGRYAAMARELPGLRGMIYNLRTPLDVMSGFFAPDAEGFSEAGTAARERFYSYWDGIGEYWFEQPQGFIDGRTSGEYAAALLTMEQSLFDAVFYREVDETVAVLPNRAPAPAYYFR